MKNKTVGENVKGYWLKWMEAVGNTASEVANNTRYKVEEAKLLSRRQSIMDRLGETAYVLWQKGEKFPAKLDEMLKDLDDTNGKLNTLHSEHLAWIKQKEKAAADDKAEVDKAAEAGTDDAAERACEPVTASAETPAPAAGSFAESGRCAAPDTEEAVHDAETAVDAAVEALHNAEEAIVSEMDEATADSAKDGGDVPPKPLVDEMSERLDGMIDQLGGSLKRLGSEIDQGLNRLSDRLIGPQKTGGTSPAGNAGKTDAEKADSEKTDTAKTDAEKEARPESAGPQG